MKDIDWAKKQIDLRDTGTTDMEDPQFHVNVGLLMALEFLNQLDETEVVYVDDLQNLLVPKQEEVDRAYKDGYEKGKEHATRDDEPETVASVMADYFGAVARLKEVLAMEVEEMEENDND